MQKQIDFEKPALGPIDIMPPTKNEKGGYDTIELLFFGEWSNDFESFFDSLKEYQSRAQNSKGSRPCDYWQISGRPVDINPSGARRGLYCHFVLKWQGITFSIVNTKKSEGNTFGVHVSIGSLSCMQLTGKGAVEQARFFLRECGFRASRIKLSRVDVCVDFAGVSADDVTRHFISGHVVMRPKKSSLYLESKKFNAFTCGSGKAVKIRVYDKLKELSEQSLHASFKRDYLVQNRWGGLPEQALRVEFQLRRAALNEFEIDSFDDFDSRAGEVVAWLSKTWFRMTKSVPKKGHTQEAEVSVFWSKVQKAFALVFGLPASATRRKKKRGMVTTQIKSLVRQVKGCLTTVLAARGHLPTTPAALYDAVCSVVFADDLDDMFAAVFEKRAGYECWLTDYGESTI